MRTCVIAVVICAVCATGCSAKVPLLRQESKIAHTITRTGWVKWATTEHFQGHGFIKTVSLTAGAVIEITFFRDMNPETLNHKTLRVISEKQGRDVTDAFSLEYNPLSRRLTLRPAHPQFDFGTGNVVTIRVSSDVRDQNDVPMGKEFEFSFST